MPTVLRSGTYRFHFYSDEGKESPHVHVETPEGECKFWLEPIRLAGNKGINPFVLRNIERLVYQNKEMLKEKFNEYHRR